MRQTRLACRQAMEQRMHDRALCFRERRFRRRERRASVMTLVAAIMASLVLRRRRLRSLPPTEWPPCLRVRGGRRENARRAYHHRPSACVHRGHSRKRCSAARSSRPSPLLASYRRRTATDALTTPACRNVRRNVTRSPSESGDTSPTNMMCLPLGKKRMTPVGAAATPYRKGRIRMTPFSTIMSCSSARAAQSQETLSKRSPRAPRTVI